MSPEVTRLEEILKTLTSEQLRYVAARPSVRYDYQAAEAIGLARETVARWENKADIDEAVRLMLMDGVKVAVEILRRNLARAASEIADELDHKGVNVRHMAAVEILDRVMGKAAQSLDVTSKGEKIFIVSVTDE